MMHWHSDPLGRDQETILYEIERSFSVRLISTNSSIEYVDSENKQKEARRLRNDKKYDTIPVKNGEIYIGFFDFASIDSDSTYENPPFTHITSSRIICENTPLMDYILSAQSNKANLVLSGSNVSGIITPSDLSKLPVSSLVFTGIIHLEMLISRLLEIEFCESKKKDIQCIGDKQAEKRWKEFTDDRLGDQRWSAFNIKNKLTLLEKWECNAILLAHHDDIKIIKNNTKDVRDTLVHGRTVVIDLKALTSLREYCTSMRNLIAKFSQSLRASSRV